jgi:hypothetical protein
VFVFGGDTLKMNPWLQGGNRFGTTGNFGTLDDNPIDYYTNNTLRGRWATNGNLIIGSSDDEGNRFQLRGTGGISINPNLSRPGDRIMIGGFVNTTDGQNILISTSRDGGAKYRHLMFERNGSIGLGTGAPHNWDVGDPLVRCYPEGVLSLMPMKMYFGRTPGPWNTSALVTEVSNTNEWLVSEKYPNGQHHYYFGTRLGGDDPGKVRAPLWISGRELLFKTGAAESTSIKIAENRNVMIGTETDNGDKLQVIGNVYANGNKHLLGNLAIVSGMEPVVAGSGVGIRVDHHTYGSFILQGSNQGLVKDMFVFNDAYTGLGQDVISNEYY